MPKKEKENSLKSHTQSLTEAAQKLHALTEKRKELMSIIREKNTSLDHCISQNITDMRDQERQKRIEQYGEVEVQRQKITSSLMQELMQICQEMSVPPYIVVVAKILDNYQGKKDRVALKK